MKKITIFEMHVKPYFYADTFHRIQIQGERTGESPAVLSMPCIGLACSDSPSFINQNLHAMHANKDNSADIRLIKIQQKTIKLLTKQLVRAYDIIQSISKQNH